MKVNGKIVTKIYKQLNHFQTDMTGLRKKKSIITLARDFTDIYSRTLDIETADLSQSHADLNLFQFQNHYLFGIN